MVADFCSLVILIHNTLQGEITISSTWLKKNYMSIPLYVLLILFHISLLILWLLIMSYEEDRKHGQNVE